MIDGDDDELCNCALINDKVARKKFKYKNKLQNLR